MLARKLVLLAAVGLTVGACQPKPSLIYGNEATVQIGHMTSRNEKRGFALAEQHCKKYGKVPRIIADQGPRVTFDCVKP